MGRGLAWVGGVLLATARGAAGFARAEAGSGAARAARTRLDAATPKLCVLDLDDCVWSPEMYTLDQLPSEQVRGDLGGRGEGVFGVKSGFETIRVFPGALAALQECADGKHDYMRLAVASSADTPFATKCAYAALDALEVLPGLSLRALLARGWPDGFTANVQIGRTPPLSSDKSRTHFPILKEATGVEYSDMIFFDDSNWSDHCGIVERNCPGVVAQRTPRGLQVAEFRACLDRYAAVRQGAAAQ